MVKRIPKKKNLENQALINKRKLEEQIRVCELTDEIGNTKAAKRISASGRTMGSSTVRQIYVTYQVFLASKIIQELFYAGMISWNDIYKSRKIYNKGHIERDALIKFENNLLSSAATNREELATLIKAEGDNSQKVGIKIDRYETVDAYYQTLEEEIHQSKLDALTRKKRLKVASKKPDTLEIIHRIFKRNSDVIAEVLERAKGTCEYCEKAAPFIRKSDKTPFLEVHHKIPLAKGGEDTVENAVALCPNCHREMHYGFLS
jgi:5-methylcytosine-specific restriction endonuclease McrA